MIFSYKILNNISVISDNFKRILSFIRTIQKSTKINRILMAVYSYCLIVLILLLWLPNR